MLSLWEKKRLHEVTWISVVVGSFVFTLLGLIPVLGWLVALVSIIVVAGAIVGFKLEVLDTWR